MPGEAFWVLLMGGLLCSLGAIGGLFMERRRLGFVIRDQAARNSDLSRRLTESDRVLEEVQAENRTLSNFLVALPDVVRRLNTNTSKRQIPSLLGSCLEQLFDPSQILVFLSRSDGALVLTHAKGGPEGLERSLLIQPGEGRIGLVARHQMAMEGEDFHSESMFRRDQIGQQDPPGVSLDLIAPLVHEGKTHGVISVGSPARRHRDNKRLIKLVADLGALALSNHEMVTKLENLANRDSLTNLSTKRFLNLKLGELVHKSQQNHTPLSVIIFDIDHFKQFNDTCGHLAGDEILKGAAALMRAQLRGDDIPARYGGEEFVIVLPNTSKDDAVRIAEKIRKAIESHPFPGGNGVPPRTVTVSGGVAALMLDGKSSQELLSAADQALYLAKERGRNRIVEYRLRYLSDDEDELEAVG
ncbi:MAG TPA: sensor domain-containing diguanylate cyclase [Candidatus Polarisedimenticolia bacterium]|nr:sensor domain-containing diguanylate cyclase [Candidatus Polarisedimenticolia bacterium]